MTLPSFITHAECGTCGARRSWTHALHLSAEGEQTGTVSPNSLGGPLDDPCPACGETDRVKVGRNWTGPHDRIVSGSAWRYHGPGQIGQGWNVPHPDGEWPEPVALADVVARPIVGTALRMDAQPAPFACERCAPGHWTPCPHSFACPRCGAAAGSACKRPSGHRAEELHAERLQLARADWTPEQHAAETSATPSTSTTRATAEAPLTLF